MNNPDAFLSTLAESTAAIVAIVGGFLVSRLVAISTERDGLKRQHDHSRDQLKHVSAAYEQAHAYRLRLSEQAFEDLVLDRLVGVPAASIDREAILTSNIPRGSSREEMDPYLEHLIQRVKGAADQITARLHPDDNDQLSLDDLEGRGLSVPDREREIYLRVTDSVASQLPAAHLALGFAPSRWMPRILSQAAVSTQMRRRDESIHEEQKLEAQQRLLQTETDRLCSEITLAGRPVGVKPAIAVLALYSLLGVVAPVVVMGLHPATLSGWETWTLLAVFFAGLLAVLAYILWYAHTFNAAVVTEDKRSIAD